MRRVLTQSFFAGINNVVGVAILAAEFSAAVADTIMDALSGRPSPDHESKSLRAAAAVPAESERLRRNMAPVRRSRAA